MEQVRIEGIDVLRARGDGPALVLVHGAGGNGETWRPVLASLQGFDVWCPSLPGRCGSPGPAAQTADEAAAWLGRLIDAAGIERPIVVGHSFGGAVAIELALARGGTLGGIALVASGARLRVAPAILEAAERATEAAPLPLDFAFGPSAPAVVVRGYADLAARTPPEAALADWRACDRFDRIADLARIGCTALVVHGSEDALTPPKRQVTLAEQLPGARRVAVEGAGHMLPWERPEELAAALRGVAERR